MSKNSLDKADSKVPAKTPVLASEQISSIYERIKSPSMKLEPENYQFKSPENYFSFKNENSWLSPTNSHKSSNSGTLGSYSKNSSHPENKGDSRFDFKSNTLNKEKIDIYNYQAIGIKSPKSNYLVDKAKEDSILKSSKLLIDSAKSSGSSQYIFKNGSSTSIYAGLREGDRPLTKSNYIRTEGNEKSFKTEILFPQSPKYPSDHKLGNGTQTLTSPVREDLKTSRTLKSSGFVGNNSEVLSNSGFAFTSYEGLKSKQPSRRREGSNFNEILASTKKLIEDLKSKKNGLDDSQYSNHSKLDRSSISTVRPSEKISQSMVSDTRASKSKTIVEESRKIISEIKSAIHQSHLLSTNKNERSPSINSNASQKDLLNSHILSQTSQFVSPRRFLGSPNTEAFNSPSTNLQNFSIQSHISEPAELKKQLDPFPEQKVFNTEYVNTDPLDNAPNDFELSPQALNDEYEKLMAKFKEDIDTYENDNVNKPKQNERRETIEETVSKIIEIHQKDTLQTQEDDDEDEVENNGIMERDYEDRMIKEFQDLQNDPEWLNQKVSNRQDREQEDPEIRYSFGGENRTLERFINSQQNNFEPDLRSTFGLNSNENGGLSKYITDQFKIVREQEENLEKDSDVSSRAEKNQGLPIHKSLITNLFKNQDIEKEEVPSDALSSPKFGDNKMTPFSPKPLNEDEFSNRESDPVFHPVDVVETKSSQIFSTKNEDTTKVLTSEPKTELKKSNLIVSKNANIDGRTSPKEEAKVQFKPKKSLSNLQEKNSDTRSNSSSMILEERKPVTIGISLFPELSKPVESTNINLSKDQVQNKPENHLTKPIDMKKADKPSSVSQTTTIKEVQLNSRSSLPDEKRDDIKEAQKKVEASKKVTTPVKSTVLKLSQELNSGSKQSSKPAQQNDLSSSNEKKNSVQTSNIDFYQTMEFKEPLLREEKSSNVVTNKNGEKQEEIDSKPKLTLLSNLSPTSKVSLNAKKPSATSSSTVSGKPTNLLASASTKAKLSMITKKK